MKLVSNSATAFALLSSLSQATPTSDADQNQALQKSEVPLERPSPRLLISNEPSNHFRKPSIALNHNMNHDMNPNQCLTHIEPTLSQPSLSTDQEQCMSVSTPEAKPAATTYAPANEPLGFGGAPNLEVPALSLKEWHEAEKIQDPIEQKKAKEAFASKIDDAFGRFGFLAIKDHGIDQTLIDQAFEVAQSFFDLPRSEKMQLHLPGRAGQRGYTPDGETAKGSQAPDIKEFVQLGEGQNPQPKALPEFLPTLESVIQEFSQLGRQLLQAIALQQLGDEHFFDSVIDDQTSLLRLLHYPPLPDAVPAFSERAAAHEDINLITLLLNGRSTGTDGKTSGQGLQLKVPKNNVRAEQANPEDFHWVNAIVPKGAMIINIGEMLENWTNGSWRATTHRVINPPVDSEERKAGRLSMPYFVHPVGTFSLKPHEKSIERAGGTRHYRDISAHDALQERLRELGLLTDGQ